MLTPLRSQSGFGETKKTPNSEVVLLLRILAHEINYGYGSRNSLVVKRFNGETVENLSRLVSTSCTTFSCPSNILRLLVQLQVDAVRNTNNEFLSFEFYDTNRTIVLDTARAREAEREILDSHGINSSCSPELRNTMNI